MVGDGAEEEVDEEDVEEEEGLASGGEEEEVADGLVVAVAEERWVEEVGVDGGCEARWEGEEAQKGEEDGEDETGEKDDEAEEMVLVSLIYKNK